jgi:hypothetical protein
MCLGYTAVTYIESVVSAGQQQPYIVTARAAEITALIFSRATTIATIPLFSHRYFTLLVKTSSIRPYSFASAAVSQ